VRSVLEIAAPIERTRASTGRAPLLAFVTDAESERAIRDHLAELGVGDAKITRGGIAKAIDVLGTQRSPDLLIVDITGDDLPVSRVHSLAEVCEPGVTVVAIGDRNEIGLYRDLLHAGISDYIVKPLTAQLVARVLTAKSAPGEVAAIQRRLGTMVAVIGARGGVGTTTIAVNLAWYLANQQNRRVALLDLDLHNGNCAMALNVKATPGLREALVSPTRIDNTLLDRVMAPVGERLFVLSAEEPLRDNVDFTAEAVETLVAALREQFHYVIVDVPRTPSAPFLRALDIADFRIVVADETLRSARDTVRLRDALGEGDGQHRNLFVVNRDGEGGRHAITLDEMQHILELRPKSVIPFQPTMFSAAAGGAEVAAAQGGKFRDAISALAFELSGRAPEQRRRWWWSAR
jgi:pilus assembly protein CpaE